MSASPTRARRSLRTRTLRLEALETRELLSVATPSVPQAHPSHFTAVHPAAEVAHAATRQAIGQALISARLARHGAHPMAIVKPTQAPQHGGSPNASNGTAPYDPTQIRHAYGFDQISNDGSGQTIAIVDAYDDPHIADDLKTFDGQFGLPDPTFTKVNQTGGTSYPQYDSGWSTEIALDVEWAHAIAPKANILLVEATTNGFSDLMAAVDYAKANASVVSMSWGSREFSGETSYDSHFAGANGVTFVASSGDSGGVINWPAVSTHVVGVGGTSLTLNSDSSYKSETGWSGSGGGVSSVEAAPSYQSSLSYKRRASPDVSYNADPNTGVYVYDNSGGASGTQHWYEVGGTSAAAPQWAAIVSLANQGRGAKGNLTGDTQLLAAIYNQTLAGRYHDITSGRAGKNRAGNGYDLVTGMGSPIGNQVVTALVGL